MAYTQDRGPGGHNPEEDARACIDLLKAKIKKGAFKTSFFVPVDAILRFLGPGYVEFRADFEPILARIARSHSCNRGSMAHAHARRLPTTVIPAPGMARRRLRPRRPSHVRIALRFSMGF